MFIRASPFSQLVPWKTNPLMREKKSNVPPDQPAGSAPPTAAGVLDPAKASGTLVQGWGRSS